MPLPFQAGEITRKFLPKPAQLEYRGNCLTFSDSTQGCCIVVVLMLTASNVAAQQWKRHGFHDFTIDKLADQQRIITAEVDHPVEFVTPLQHAGVFFRIVGHQNALGITHHAAAVLKALLLQALLQQRQSFFFGGIWRVVGQFGCRCAWACAVYKRIGKKARIEKWNQTQVLK